MFITFQKFDVRNKFSTQKSETLLKEPQNPKCMNRNVTVTEDKKYCFILIFLDITTV